MGEKFLRQEMQTENKGLQRMLDKQGLITVSRTNDEDENIYRGYRDLDRSSIIEGMLLKFGKTGKRKAKQKHVVFVAHSHGCYVEWTEVVRANQAIHTAWIRSFRDFFG